MGKSLIIKGADFSQNGIVPDYIKLDWIGASNAQNKYIPSGIMFGAGIGELEDELEMCVSLDASKLNEGTTSASSCGAQKNTNAIIKAWIQSSKVTLYFASASVNDSRSTVSKDVSVNLWDGNRHTIIINKTGGSIDGTAYSFDNTPDLDGLSTDIVANAQIYLDSYSLTASNGYNSVVNSDTEDALKIHCVKYRRNNTLILDAIPVMRTDDDKVGFYDKVTGTYKFRNDDSTPAYGA